MVTSLSKIVEAVQTQSRIKRFLKRFHVARLLWESGFSKVKGYPLIDLVEFLLTLVFTHKNLYRLIHSDKNNCIYGKDSVYGVLNDPRFDWRKLQLKLGGRIIKDFLAPLTDDNRVSAIVIDDSTYARNRSKKVELLARLKDHVTGSYYRGFKKLTAGWTDGATFIPLAFSLQSSQKEENRLYEQGPDVPLNTPGHNRRREAVQSSTEMVLELLDQIINQVSDFQYVLFDSWFSWPKVIRGIKDRGYNVICMLKDMPHLQYKYQGNTYRLSELYEAVAKNGTDNKSECIATVEVDYYGLPVRIVFVRNRNNPNKREWLALLSTNTDLPVQEIIRIYGLRWDIEVYFKVCKSYLRLAKEFQSRSYDAMIAHTTIVSMRYMMLAVENREQIDDRAHGGIFYQFCDEVADMDFAQAFFCLLDLLKQALRDNLFLSESMASEFISRFMDNLPKFLKARLYLQTA